MNTGHTGIERSGGIGNGLPEGREKLIEGGIADLAGAWPLRMEASRRIRLILPGDGAHIPFDALEGGRFFVEISE